MRMLAYNDLFRRIGEDHQNATLTNRDIERLLAMFDEGYRCVQLAKIFDISRQHAWRICKGIHRSQTAAEYRPLPQKTETRAREKMGGGLSHIPELTYRGHRWSRFPIQVVRKMRLAEMQAHLISRVAEGESIRSIMESFHQPMDVWARWRAADDELEAAYQRAREIAKAQKRAATKEKCHGVPDEAHA